MFNWTDVNVLITGATGFIGSWLTETLLEKKAKITVLIKKDDPLGFGGIEHIKDKVKVVYGDVCKNSTLSNAIKDQTFIFHLAAITQVLYALKNPVETFKVDAIGTLNILEEIRKSKSDPYLVYASTDKVYGEPKYLPIDEKHILNAKSPYDASKLAADRLVSSYHNSYNVHASIIRWSNTYGGRDSNILRIVPDFVLSLLNGKAPVIRGNGKGVRDYMYVTDSVNGIILTAENMLNGEVFNFGTGNPTSVKELANMIIKLMGYENKLKPVMLNKVVPGEIRNQYLSYKKAKKILKWKPVVDLRTGLIKTVEWYKENPHWKRVIEKVNNYYGIKNILRVM